MEAIHYIAIAGIAAALFIGVKSSLDTKRLQEKQSRHNDEIRQGEQRQKLLDEVINWAIDIVDVGFGRGVVVEPQPRIADQRFSLVATKLFQYQAADVRRTYITAIVEILDKEVYDSVLKLSSELEKVREAISECIKDNDNFESHIDAVSTFEQKLRESALRLITTATKIKTRNVGL